MGDVNMEAGESTWAQSRKGAELVVEDIDGTSSTHSDHVLDPDNDLPSAHVLLLLLLLAEKPIALICAGFTLLARRMAPVFCTVVLLLLLLLMLLLLLLLLRHRSSMNTNP